MRRTGVDYDRDLKCMDCKHSKADFINRLLKKSYAFHCGLPEAWVEGNYDPVTGITTKGYWEFCSVMRIKEDTCGPKAKRWTPRNSKLIFLALQKG